MFRVLLSALTALLIASASIASAETQDLFWERLEKLIQQSGYTIVAKSDSHRRAVCTKCSDDISVVISVTTLTPKQKALMTIQQALVQSLKNRCRDLVQSGEGRCAKPDLIEYSDGRVLHEAVLLYDGKIILGHAVGPKGSPELTSARGPWLKKLLESLTPLY